MDEHDEILFTSLTSSLTLTPTKSLYLTSASFHDILLFLPCVCLGRSHRSIYSAVICVAVGKSLHCLKSQHFLSITKPAASLVVQAHMYASKNLVRTD